MHIITTTKELIEYISSLSYYVERVIITSVSERKFNFIVQVPLWYKFTLGIFLKNKIKKQLAPRMPIGVRFDFILFSKNFF